MLAPIPLGDQPGVSGWAASVPRMEAEWRDHRTAIVSALLILVICGAVAYLLLVRRRVGAPGARRRSIAEVGLVVGTAPWLVALFTPQDVRRSASLIPLRDLATLLAGSPGTAIAQIVGNLVVLVAVGFFLPMRLPAAASPPAVLVITSCSAVLIETMQWALAIGRVSSVDDVLLNTLGAVLAARASQRWWATEKRGICEPASVA